MTAFDDRLFATLESLADEDDRIQISTRQLADILDVSVRSVRESEKRLMAGGRIAVIPNENPALASVIRLADHDVNHDPYHDPQGGLTEGLGSQQPHRGRAVQPPTPTAPPTGSADHEGEETKTQGPRRDVNRDCLMCEGSGWVELPDGTNTVEPCRCINPEWRRQWRERRRVIARSWPRDAVKENDRPAKADYMKLWVEYTRRRLSEVEPGAPPPSPEPEIARLRLVDDPDEKF